MKKIKIILASLAVLIGMNGCGPGWLDTDMTGSTLTEDQFNNLGEVATAGLVNGMYVQMYSNSGSSHHYFGQKSVDMATDIISSDMAMTANAYGWFVECEQRQITSAGAGRNSYHWTLYYNMIMNANQAVRAYKLKGIENLTASELNSYAEVLTMRAYCYYNIINLYSPARGDNFTYAYAGNKTGLEYLLCPIYDENCYDAQTGLILEQKLSPLGEVYDLVVADLTAAVQYFDSANVGRQNKLHVDGDVARGLLAYTYLQYGGHANLVQYYDSAFEYATQVINRGNYRMLPYDKVLTTGFTDVNSESWMWGLDVTRETSTALASFWGHIDVHTYSYAYAGATKAMDQNLFDEIPTTDIRRQWFDSTKKNIPDHKFYDLGRGVTADEIDRDWLNDIVYMRIEEMYLIAAEAATRVNNLSDAADYLQALVEHRDPTVAQEISSMSQGELIDQLYFNWRVEMWGEGRALMTFKRFGADGKGDKLRGTNHFYESKTEAHYNESAKIYFMLPSGEFNTNNAILKQLTGGESEE